MSINVDLGNIWEMLSAIGTVGAVIVSLWLARGDNRKKLTIAVRTSMIVSNLEVENIFYSIDIVNVGNRRVKIKQVYFKQIFDRKKKLIITNKTELSDELPKILEPEDSSEYYADATGFKKSVRDMYYIKRFKAYCVDSSGKVYKSRPFSI